MKNMLNASALWVSGALLLTQISTRGQAPGDVIPGQYIVQLRAGANGAAVAARHGAAPRFQYSAALNGFAGFVPPGRLNALQNDPDVASVTPDRVVTAIGKPGGGGTTASQVVPEGIKRVGAAPGALAFTGTSMGVAVVDTGIDLAHPDLAGTVNLFSSFGGSAQDNQGHGTHVAGTIAARSNNLGVVGVAPAATLYAVKVLDAAGNGSDASVNAGLEAVLIAKNSGAAIHVVNMSLGRPSAGAGDTGNGMQTAIQNLTAAGITVVVAAGNDCGMVVTQQVPAGFPEVIAVSSTTAKAGTRNKFGYQIQADTASYFTTDGPEVTIAAPGEDQENVNNAYFISSVGILSTALGGGTTRMSGTSMASPHVAGVVALLYQKSWGVLTAEAARAALVGGASRAGVVPLASPTSCYTADGELEGVVSAPGALALIP